MSAKAESIHNLPPNGISFRSFPYVCSILYYMRLMANLLDCSLSRILRARIYYLSRTYLHSFIDFWCWIFLLSLFTDHWLAKCVHTATHTRGLSRCISRYGAYGCESMPGHSNGSRSWANVLLALSDALRHQAFTLGWNHT